MGPFTYIKARDKLQVEWDDLGRVAFKVSGLGEVGGVGVVCMGWGGGQQGSTAAWRVSQRGVFV